MVFSDLDGTLIDHHTYDWSPAKPALDALSAIGAAVVLASSKTATEIDVLRREMSLERWPAIVENGAGVLGANTAPQVGDGPYIRLRDTLDGLPKGLRRLFVGFGDMTAQDVSSATGLTHAGAVLAQQRAFSEPGIWQGTEHEQEAFLTHLAEKGIVAQQGGRFLTLSFGATKADQVNALRHEYAPDLTIALGDAPNDIKMLEACDYGVVIANPSRAALPALRGEAEGRILRTEGAGPAAWNGAILDLMARLNLA